MQNSLTRRVLPPGIQEDIVFGILWIRVGAFKTVKPSTTSHKVNIQFWGETSPAFLYTSQTNPVPLEYDIKCPITFFEKYLLDMKKNLKIEVQNLGNVFLDLTKYLTKNITLTTKSPFEHFKGYFEVIGKNNKKTGSLQLELCANFNPQIALRQMEDDEKEQICPAEKLQACECRGQCKCRPDKIAALDVIAVQKPDLFKEFYQESKQKTSPKKPIQIPSSNDDRIPNSLNSIPNKGMFDPNKYAEAVTTPKAPQHFPTVEKILTYSNLKLKKQEEVHRQSSRPISIKDYLNPHPEKVIGSDAVKVASPIAGKQILKEQINKPSEFLVFNEVKPAQKEVKKVENQSPPMSPVAQAKLEHRLSEVSEVQKVDESVSVQAQKEILSRVVNLNEQLQRERKVSPKKPLQKEKETIERIKSNEVKQINSIPNLLPQPANIPYSYGQYTKKKISTLLLNLVVQLQTTTVSFTKQGKFVLSYRPYGQKESIRVGPQLPQTLKMMFPVGQPQIAKMNKIPLILQFWQSNDGGLLGIVKLSLIKIQKGFMLDGRLNQVAIKTSLLPTVIHNGIHKICNLVDKPVGECYLNAYIGTSAQIQSYLNRPKEENNAPKPPQKQKMPKKQEPKSQEDANGGLGTLQELTNLLQLIDHNSIPQFLQKLFEFMKLGEVNQKQFKDFLSQLSYNSNVFHFLSESDTFKSKQLEDCFQDYKKIKQKILGKASNIIKELPKEEVSRLIGNIKANTHFGMVSKKDLDDIFQEEKFHLIRSLFFDIVPSQNMVEWLQSPYKLALKQIKVTEQSSASFISDLFLSQVLNYMDIINRIITTGSNNNELSLFSIKNQFVKKNNKCFSIWFWIQLAKIVYDSFGEHRNDSKTINTSLLYNWLALKFRQEQQKEVQQEQNNNPPEDKKQNTETKKENPIQQIHKEPQNRPNSSRHLQDNQEKKPLHNEGKQYNNNEPNKQNKESNQSIRKQKQEDHQQKQQQKIIQHKFVVSLEQLQIQEDYSGQCVVFYRFPFEEQQIGSRKIQLLREKHKYKLICSGTHKFTINQAIQQYFGESTLSVRVAIGKQTEFYGDLHSEELITKGTEFRILPLFTANKEGIAGKIKIKIEYAQQVTRQLTLGRQTIRDVFLPKNGYLNFQMSTSVDQNRLRQQFSFKDQFYIQISLDLFGQNSMLAPQFPPFHSKLYSDLSSELSISGTVKLSLTPPILQHLRSGSCHARMLAIYYVKQKRTYERKDLLIASFKAPLFGVIRQDGLKGDYAFKNKLGMFISLAHCSIKYQKTAHLNQRGGNEAIENSRQNFWLLIDFTEIINFQGDLGWVRFQFVSKGKRLTTEKSLIRQFGAFTLDSRCLCLQFGEEQFSLTKVLPINLIAGSQKYGLDINLRPIAKVLGRQKYTVNSHYFLVVDDQSKTKKIRIGAKIYAFRGQASLGPFVQALSKNSIRNDSIGDQKDQNYQQNLQNLRKKLKMSNKAFVDSLGQFLDKKKNQKLPNSFFISKIHSSLDLSPILTFNQSDPEMLAEELSSEIDQRSLLDYIQQSGLKLLNLRSQFLQRYSFSKLNQLRLDQNVEYLGLNQQIDLLVFISKIKLQEFSHIQQNKEATVDRLTNNHRMVRISIVRGYDFQLLYNGIMPNSRVCMPQIGLETELIERSSEPIFNEHINFEVSQPDLKRLKVQVFHQSFDEDSDAVLIGQGSLSISQALATRDLPFSKVTRIVLSSQMSARMQAALDIKIEVQQAQQAQIRQNIEKDYSDIDESIGYSRVEEEIQRMREINDYRKKVDLFQSSDED